MNVSITEHPISQEFIDQSKGRILNQIEKLKLQQRHAKVVLTVATTLVVFVLAMSGYFGPSVFPYNLCLFFIMLFLIVVIFKYFFVSKEAPDRIEEYNESLDLLQPPTIMQYHAIIEWCSNPDIKTFKKRIVHQGRELVTGEVLAMEKHYLAAKAENVTDEDLAVAEKRKEQFYSPHEWVESIFSK